MSKITLKAEYIRATRNAQQMGTSNAYVVNVVANLKDKDGNDLEPEFSEILLFGDAATKYGMPDSPSFIKKGQSLSVEGLRQKKKWKDKDGNEQVTEQILVSKEDMITLYPKNTNADASAPSNGPDPASSNFSDDDDSPFN